LLNNKVLLMLGIYVVNLKFSTLWIKYQIVYDNIFEIVIITTTTTMTRTQ